MSQTLRKSISTSLSNVTYRHSRSRTRTSPNSTETIAGDDIELHPLLPPSRRTSEDGTSPTEGRNSLCNSNQVIDDLQEIISGTLQSDNGQCESNQKFTERRPPRKIVDALNTLIRGIDHQHHIPPRWTHVRPWLDTATRSTPSTRSKAASAPPTVLIVPPAARRFLAASRHESWDDETRKAARVVRTWVGYDVLSIAVSEVWIRRRRLMLLMRLGVPGGLRECQVRDSW